MNKLFQPYLCKFVRVFFDDILIFSRSWEDHLHHLNIVFSTLRKHTLFVKISQKHTLFVKKSKCQFAQQEVSYLGHVINHEGVSVDQNKIQAMLEWPKPNTLKALWVFFRAHRLLPQVCSRLWKDCQTSYLHA